MKSIIQYVTQAEVVVDGERLAAIHSGYVIFTCVVGSDTADTAKVHAKKIASLRVIPDANGKLNQNLFQSQGEILLISQFTLAAKTDSNRPSFDQAAPKNQALELLELVRTELVNTHHLPVQTGRFGARMQVNLTNAGPITIPLET